VVGQGHDPSSGAAMTTPKHDPHGIGAVPPAELKLGMRVRYYPVLPAPEGIAPLDTTTRSDPWQLGHGAWVVKIAGKAGGVDVTHLRPIQVTMPIKED